MKTHAPTKSNRDRIVDEMRKRRAKMATVTKWQVEYMGAIEEIRHAAMKFDQSVTLENPVSRETAHRLRSIDNFNISEDLRTISLF